jgi:hypothetical protein
MQFLIAFGAALALAPAALGKEMAKDMERAELLYDSGIMMERIMMTKQVRLSTFCPKKNLFLGWTIRKLTKNDRNTGPSKKP